MMIGQVHRMSSGKQLMPAAMALLIFAACGPFGNSPTASGSNCSQTLNIAVFGEFSASLAVFGTEKLQGVQTAINEINSAGGVLCHKVVPIPIDAEDPVDSVNAARQVLAADNVSLVVGPDVLSGMTTLPIFEQAKMVNFTYIGNPGIYTGQNWKYSFQTNPSDAIDGVAMVDYALQKGYKKIALLFDANIAQGFVAPIQAAAKTLGIDIVANEAPPSVLTSYEGYLKPIVDAKPDAILDNTLVTTAGLLFQQLQALGGGSIPIIGSDVTGSPDWVKAIGGTAAFRNLVSVVPGLDLTSPVGQHFSTEFQALYKGNLPSILAGHHYDAVMVGVYAMIAANSLDPAVYVNKILDVTSPDSTHQTVSTFADGLRLLKQGALIKYFGVGSPMIYSSIHTVTATYSAVTVDPVTGAQTVVGTIPGTDLLKLTVGYD